MPGPLWISLQRYEASAAKIQRLNTMQSRVNLQPSSAEGGQPQSSRQRGGGWEQGAETWGLNGFMLRSHWKGAAFKWGYWKMKPSHLENTVYDGTFTLKDFQSFSFVFACCLFDKQEQRRNVIGFS